MLLRELFEAESKTAVLAFGRMNPPTIGHAKLVNKIKSIPGDHFLFLSHSQDRKKDPLDFNTKLKFAKAFFPGIEIGREGVNTPVAALQYIQSLGYNNVVFVAGSDRVEGFQKLFDTYNGTPDKSGKIPFQFDGITVVSAGERDPDADGAEGMSASKMRAAAAEGNFEAFKQGTPNPNYAQQMYTSVRKSMGIEQTVSEVFNTKAINAKWSGSGDMTAMEFTARNGIEHKIDFLAPYIGPDEIYPTDFIPNMSDELVDQSIFIEFEQKGATGQAKQGVAGTGAAAEVFGIVTNAILEFVSKRKPPMIYFQAAETNRRKLYAAIVNKLVKSMPGWATMSKDGHFALYQKNIVQSNKPVSEDQGNITPELLKKLEYYLDRMFAALGIDVEFTKHFLDRVNDERNVKPITIQELAKLFKDTYAKWGKKIAQLGPNAQAVIKDMSTDINLPFVLNWDNSKKELDLVAKTIMRKKNFTTPNQQFQVESTNLKKNEPDLISAMKKFLPIAINVLKLDKLPKIKFEKYIAHRDQPSFGRFVNATTTIHLGIENRHPNDILRTLAHELVHYKQLLDNKLNTDSGKTGSPEENEAHIKAGVIMRLFNKRYPDFFKEPAVDIEESEVKINYIEPNFDLEWKATVWAFKVPNEILDENFADGKVKGKSRPGRVKRAGASCKGSVTDLRRRAKVGGERGKMYHWCANMKSGKK